MHTHIYQEPKTTVRHFCTFDVCIFPVGTCGQHQLWNINDHNTYMHPFIPGEILMDPLSLPSCLKSYDSKTTETITQRNVQMRYSQHLDDAEVPFIP